MALLNPPNILPEAMRFLIRAVLATKERSSHDDLVELVGPPGLAEAMNQIHGGEPDSDEQSDVNLKDGGRKIANDSLATLLQLGLLEVVDGMVGLGRQADQSWRRVSNVTGQSFIESFESALLTERGHEVGIDLLGAAAVMFSVDRPLHAFDGFDEAAATRRFVEYQQHELGSTEPDSWPVVNIERWRSLRRLGPALGWMDPVAYGTRLSLVPNAAPALRRWLPELEAELYPGGEFLRQASGHLPFLDGGSLARRQIGAAGSLSGGLSLTLLSLQHSQNIELVRQADASTYEASLAEQHQLLFSHVRVHHTRRTKRRKP